MSTQLPLVAALITFVTVGGFCLLNSNRGTDHLLYSTLGSLLGGILLFVLVRFNIATLGGTDAWNQVDGFWKFIATSIALFLSTIQLLSSLLGSCLTHLIVRKKWPPTAQCWALAVGSSLFTGSVFAFLAAVLTGMMGR